MSNNKKSAGGMFGKGYYIALILCAAAIGITGYMYYRNTQEQSAQLLETEPDAAIVATEGEKDVAVIATQPHQEDKETPFGQATEPTVKKTLATTAPVEGEEVMGYSMEALSYNQTTRDWRVHNGVDIAAEAGTEVVAAADGEVYTIYEDDSMGVTVVIRHTGGYNTKYSSLSEDLAVSVGDRVTMGQTIGTVGTSALMENALGDHVHFTVTKDDEPVDPMEFLR